MNTVTIQNPDKTLIKYVKNLLYRKGISIAFDDFYNWYCGLERKCHYCGITEQEISFLLENGLLHTKRLVTRGRRLELDRMQPELGYENLDNITLCCYWCNNAKTDTFSYAEFVEVGKAFNRIWKHRLAKISI